MERQREVTGHSQRRPLVLHLIVEKFAVPDLPVSYWGWPQSDGHAQVFQQKAPPRPISRPDTWAFFTSTTPLAIGPLVQRSSCFRIGLLLYFAAQSLRCHGSA